MNKLSSHLSILFLFLLSFSIAQDVETITQPDWHNIKIVNVITDEAFTLASLNDKIVFVEPMATTCSYCSYQLDLVNTTKAQLIEEGLGEDFIFLALSVESNLAQEKLVKHAEWLEVDMAFAIATPELLRALANEFGRKAVHPHSTPHFIIKPDGAMTELQTGLETSEEIYDELLTVHTSVTNEAAN